MGGFLTGGKGQGALSRTGPEAIGLGQVLGVAGMVFSFVGSMFKTRRPIQPSPETAVREDEYKLAPEFPVPIVYGTQRVSGHAIFRERSLATAFVLDSDYDYAVAFCEGEVQAIRGVEIEGWPIDEVNNSDAVTYLGTSTQLGDSRFSSGMISAICEADCFTRMTEPSTNFNTDILEIAGGAYSLTYLRFNLSDIPAGYTITEAQILLSNYEGSVPMVLRGYGTDSEVWDEALINRTDGPAGTIQYSSGSISPNHNYGASDLNAAGMTALRAAYGAGTTLSFVLQGHPAVTGGFPSKQRFRFFSKESQHAPPTLSIKYESAEPPTFRYTAYAGLHVDNIDGVIRQKIPDVTAIVEGLKVVNLSTSVTEYSTNPAWCIYDFLTSSRYGAGIASGNINSASFVTVGAYCDETITKHNGETATRHTLNIVIDSKDSGKTALRHMLFTFGGYLYYQGGEIFLDVKKNKSSDFTIGTDDIIAGSFSYARTDASTIPNVVQALYRDQADDFNKKYVKAEDEISRAADDEKINEIELLGITNRPEALRRSNTILWEERRERWTCGFKLSINNIDASVGDVVTITHPVPAWVSKDFRVISMRELPNDEIELGCLEYIAYTQANSSNEPVTDVWVDPPTPPIIFPPFDTIDDWGVVGIPGGWKLAIFNYFENVEWWQVWAYHEHEEKWKFFDIIDDLRTESGDRFSGGLVKEWSAYDPTEKTRKRFKIRAHGHQQKGEFSDEIAVWSLVRSGKTKTTPTAPTLAAPSVTNLAVENGFAFRIDFTITAATGEEDAVSSYEIARADDNGTGDTFGSYVIVRRHDVDTDLPGPVTINVQNTDRVLKPTWKYRYRIRSIGLDGTPSAWSSYQQITMPGDETAPAQPTIAVTPVIVGLQIAITGGTEADFAYFKIESNTGAGGWVTANPRLVDRLWIYNPPEAVVNAGTTISFRVTAYDFSGNGSTVSSASGAAAATRVGAGAIEDSGVQGWQNTCIFSSTDFNTVAWATGIITLSNGVSYSITGANTGNMTALTYIYLSPSDSTTLLQTTTTAATAFGADKIIVAVAEDTVSGKSAAFQAFGGSGGNSQLFTKDNIAADSITANEVLANSFTGGEFAATMSITAGTGNNVARLSGVDGTYRIWAGHATAASAPFSVTKAGVTTLTKAIIKTDPTANERVEIDTNELRAYGNNLLLVEIGSVAGLDSLGKFIIRDKQSGGDGLWASTGYMLWSESGGQLAIPNVSDISGGSEVDTYGGDSSPTIRWDDSAGKLKVGTATFTPD